MNFDKGKKKHILYIAASSLDWTTHATIQQFFFGSTHPNNLSRLEIGRDYRQKMKRILNSTRLINGLTSELNSALLASPGKKKSELSKKQVQ